MAIVITHSELGVYLGGFWGLGFWSLLDAAGQESAATFEDRAQAEDHIRAWSENNDPTAYGFVEVSTDATWAEIEHLKAAGLAGILGDMELNRLKNAAPVGRA